MLGLISLTLLRQVTNHLQLVLQILGVLEDSHIDSLLLGDLGSVWTLNIRVHQNRSLWQLAHRVLPWNLLLSSIDVHLGHHLVDSLIHKHILLVCLLLIEASIHLPIELVTLPIAGCMLLHKLRVHHELRMVDHGHVLLLATILVT